MRNEQRTLTADERRVVIENRDRLQRAMRDGESVSFTYTKDNGETSTREGTVLEFQGAESKASVKIETESGARTFNLRNITF